MYVLLKYAICSFLNQLPFCSDPPSPALVDQVRNLYQQRVPDVRFLIPVLNGLGKKEVLAVLPKLIKLNHDVVKKVFSRLLGTQVNCFSLVY